MALWGDQQTKQTFSAAYNAKRHVSESFGDFEVVDYSPGSTTLPVRMGGHLIAAPEDKVLRVEAGKVGASLSSCLRRKSRKYQRGVYSIVRSDVDDDVLPRPGSTSAPGLPKSEKGMRLRTFEHAGHGFAETREETDTTLEWVESNWFQATSGVVIMCNAVVIGLETDLESWIWFWVEHALLAYFLFELIVRLLRHGCNFFKQEDEWGWNVFDLSIVTSGVADQWIMPVLHWMMQHDASQRKQGMASVFMVFRMARLLRIVRLFRLVKIVRPLYELAQSIMEALQGMFWVLVFMILTLYSVAILCTRLIGHGTVIADDDDPEMKEIKEMFSSVSTSMFTLFGTVSSWSLMKFVPLFEEMPFLQPLFVVFYIYSAWALLAVMTGVVSENMIAIRDQMQKEDEQREEKRKSMITKVLMELFREADVDNNGIVSRQEFEGMLKSPELVKKITKNTRMKVQDLIDLFDWIDHDKGGTITIDEFMNGFRWINEPLRAKSLVKLQERLAGDLKVLESTVSSIIQKRVDEVQRTVAVPLRKVHAIAEQMQSLDVQLGKIRPVIHERLSALPSEVELKEMEERLSKRLKLTLDHLAAIEAKARVNTRQKGPKS
ncbi:Cation channel sperm-associated protein 1 [Symbiodinium microadriaticum]|uniref:Cation channel sperm-associated protein 1 n=1 Tax=Symbiodinium microadriaticum TaxID=2951 RepID=A0A1Q9ETK2_SYMMI|nr:Cation channel sperm-associated protein 1 [Symbiodinium microadriaticum]